MTHTAAVQPIMDPDYDAMLQHLESLFGRAPVGMIEISWTDAKTKRLQHAQLFDVGDLDMAAEKAHEINGRDFCNVYVGAALRKPGTFPGARAKDDDFHAAWALHVDLDDAGAPEAAKTAYQDARLTPPIAIVTGRHPHTRAQLWWPLDEPVTDPEQYRRLLRALADGLYGDTTVCNPSRVMRLGGTIAWPVKEGRRTEKTELKVYKDRRQEFGVGEFERAFAAPAASVGVSVRFWLIGGSCRRRESAFKLPCAEFLPPFLVNFQFRFFRPASVLHRPGDGACQAHDA